MKKLFFACLSLLFGVGAWAQTNLASDYFQNEDFSSTEGWTSYKSDNYSNTEMGLIGALTVNGVASVADDAHATDMYCAGISARWNTNYAAWQQTSTKVLPAGEYWITFDVSNPGNSNNYNMGNLTYVQIGETKIYDEGMTAAKLKGATGWVKHTISFVLTEDSEITLSFGYKNNENKGSDDTPELFISNLRLVDAAILLAENTATVEGASATNGIVTAFVVNGTFDSNANGWASTTGAQNKGVTNNQHGAFTGNFHENWNPSNVSGKMYQTIKNIPNGTYCLNICAFVETFNADVQHVYANADQVALTAGEPTAYQVWTIVTDNTMEIGLEQTESVNKWMGIDNVFLTYFGSGDVIDEAKVTMETIAAREILASAIAVEQEKINKILDYVGTEPFQYSPTIIAVQQTLVDAPKAVYDNESATLAEIYAAVDAVKDAVEIPAFNVPAAGKVYNIINLYDGWVGNGFAVTPAAGRRTNMGNYDVLFRPVNTNLMQALTLTQVEGNTYTISFIDADGVVRYICDGTAHGGNSNQIRTTTDAENALKVVVSPAVKKGESLTYHLTSTSNVILGCQDNDVNALGLFGVSSHTDLAIVETTKAAVNLTVGAAGYATLMSPFAIASLPDGMKAYSCAAVEDNKLTLVETTGIEANTPYIIEGEGTISVEGDATGYETTYKVGLLTGVYAATEAPVGSYVLQNHDGKVGFYQVGEDTKPTVGANRAYLTVPAGDEVKAYFFDDVETAVEAVEVAAQNQTIYDLSGRRVQKAVKGLYIVDGKKVIK